MARRETMVQLSEDLIRELDAAAGKRSVSRSALIREAVQQYLANDRDAEITRQIIEGYKRIPPGTPDEWGNLEEQSDRSTRDTLQRLDEEEREAGFGPWKR